MKKMKIKSVRVCTDLKNDHLRFKICRNQCFCWKTTSLIIRFIASRWKGISYYRLTLNFVCTFSNLKAGPLNFLYSSGLSKIFSKYSHCNYEYKISRAWFSISMQLKYACILKNSTFKSCLMSTPFLYEL